MKAKTIIGWREWVEFPNLGDFPIKAKIDTGARTSALHAFEPKEFERDGQKWVKFKIHPVQGHARPEYTAGAIISDEREVTSSNGSRERRLFITTPLKVGPYVFPIELSLASRDELGFRLLIGRQALRKRFVVDPGTSFTFDMPGKSS